MLLNKEILKKYSLYPRNYDLTEVMQYVDIAEKIWILPTIGYDWYEELCEQVKENTLTPENSTALVEAIYPYLGFAVAYEALPSTLFNISEVGVTKGKSDNSESISLKDVTYLENHIKRQLQVRGDYCKKWICEHQEYYPLADYCSCGCSCCNDRNGKLNKPKSFQQLYSTKRKNTNLK